MTTFQPNCAEGLHFSAFHFGLYFFYSQKLQPQDTTFHMEVIDTLSSSDESCNLDSDSNSDYSYRAISPITEEEYDTSDSIDESEGVLPESDSLHLTTFSRGLQPASTSTVGQCGHSQTMYRLCSDNIDKTVKQRYMRSDAYKTGSIYYFHSYTVADRIDFSSLPVTTPPLPSVDVL